MNELNSANETIKECPVRDVPLSIDEDGNPLPNTEWIKVADVFSDNLNLSDKDFAKKFHKENALKDPITKKVMNTTAEFKQSIENAKQQSYQSNT